MLMLSFQCAMLSLRKKCSLGELSRFTPKRNQYFKYFLFAFICSSLTSRAGVLSTDIILSSGDYSYSEDIVVPNGITLIIESGAKLKFDNSSKLLVQAGGKLFIEGTAEKPVFFTSDAKVAGSWEGLWFEGSRATANEIMIDNAIIEYANAALYAQGAGVKVTAVNTTVRNNLTGIYVDGKNQYAPNHPVINFTNGALYNNSKWNYYTKYFSGDITTIDATGNWWGTNEPQMISGSIYDHLDGGGKPAVDFSGYRESDSGSAIGTSYAGYISGEETWNVTDGVLAQTIVVDDGGTLTIAAGTKISAKAGSKILVKAGGKLFIEGTAEKPVFFTSDAKVAGSWEGLWFEGSRATANEIMIDNAIIEYANAALYAQGAGVKVTAVNTTVRNNLTGIYVDGKNQYAPNHPVINFTNGALYNNSKWNYYTKYFSGDITTIDATGNWWGTNEPQMISGSIYDHLDGGGKPAVDFSGYRESDSGSAIGTSYAGYISGEETWNVTDGVLAQTIVVDDGGTLTIAAGTKISAKAGSKILVKAGGKLFIEGTAEKPVFFTSDAKVAGSWEGLWFEGSRATANEIMIDNAIIEYANAALYAQGAGVKVTAVNTTVRNNLTGIYVDGKNQYAPNHPVINFTNGALYNNSKWNYYTKYFSGDITTIDATGNWWGTNEPQMISGSIYDHLDGGGKPAVDFSGYRESDSGSAIGTSYAGYISGEETWNVTDGVLAQTIVVDDGGTLTIAAGTKISAKAGSKILVKAGGKLFIEGTAEKPVFFTSDAKVAGSWEGLWFEGSRATANEIMIDNAIIEYANAALYAQGAGVKVTAVNTTVRNNLTGIYVDGKNQYAPNHPVINFTNGALYNNSKWNYYTKYFSGDITTIDATGNWWGTNEPQMISGSIYDHLDGGGKPAVDFSGYLMANSSEDVIVYRDNEGNLYIKNNASSSIRYTKLSKEGVNWVVTQLEESDFTAEEWTALEAGFVESNYKVFVNDLNDDGTKDYMLNNGLEEIVLMLNSSNQYVLPIRRVVFIHTDLLGSPVAETDLNGEVN